MSYTVDFATALKALSDGKADTICRPFKNNHSEDPNRMIYFRHHVGGYYKYESNEGEERILNSCDVESKWKVNYKPEHQIYDALMIFETEKVYLDKRISLVDALALWEGPKLKAIYSVDLNTHQMTKVYEPKKGGES